MMEVLLGMQNYKVTFKSKFFSIKSYAPFRFKKKSEIIENCLFDSDQFSQNFIWRNETALLVILAKDYVSQKTF